jgi:hypothetical protein
MAESSSDRIAALLDAYLAADYRWEFEGRWRSLAIGELAPEVDTAFPGAWRYALLSAWHPHSIVRDEGINRAEDARLLEQLHAGGFASRPAFASAGDRSWREPGWLVVNIPLHVLDRLAREFGQLGTLAWERGQCVRLRMDAPVPAGRAATAHVDWLK